MSSSVAGPSKSKPKKAKATPKATSPSPPRELSKAIIESDEENESSSEREADSVDSEGDIEGVTSRRRQVDDVPQAEVSTRKGEKWPKYVPPIGMSPITISTAFTSSPFEYDKLAANPRAQLWAIRVPADLKTSRLSSLSLSIPTAKSVKGTLKTKSTTYSLLPAGTSLPASHAVVDEEGRQPTAGPGMVDAMLMDIDPTEEALRAEGGEEMGGGMRLMVPRLSDGGELFVAPKPISRHLLLTPQLHTPEQTQNVEARPLPSFLSTSIPNTTVPESSENPETLLPAKRQQPTQLLKFRNQAYGFDTPGPVPGVQEENEEDAEMAVDVEVDVAAVVGESPAAKKESRDERKKRKSVANGNGDTPGKHQKRVKV